MVFRISADVEEFRDLLSVLNSLKFIRLQDVIDVLREIICVLITLFGRGADAINNISS